MLGYVLGDDVRGTNTFCPLRNQELARRLDRRVNIIALISTIRQIVMSHIVDLVFLHKLRRIGDDPRAILYHLINPFAVPYALGALLARKDCETLPSMRLFVTCHADNEVRVWENRFRLLQLSHVPVRAR